MTQAIPFRYTVLETGADGRALFRDETAELNEYKPSLFLSTPLAGGPIQLRESPADFTMGFHCTPGPLWTFVLQGRIEYALHDGTGRILGPGDVIFVNDVLPAGASFDPTLHGHCTRSLGDVPVRTALVRL